MSAEGGGAVWACAKCGANNKMGRTNLKEIRVRVCDTKAELCSVWRRGAT